MADYFTHFSCLLDAGSPENAAKAMALFHRLRTEEADADEPAFNGFDLAQQDWPSGSHLWIHDDDQGDVEGVINFVLRLAEDLNLTGLWGSTSLTHVLGPGSRLSGEVRMSLISVPARASAGSARMNG